MAIIVFVAVYASMYYDAHVYYQLDGPKESLLSFWGNQFLELFLCLIVVYFLVYFVFNFINKKLTGESRPKITDERDNVIELKAIHASYYILALGVFVAMLSTLWFQDYSPLFYIVMSSFLVSAVVADIVRIVQYRKSS